MSSSLCLCMHGCTHPHNACADTYIDHTYIYRKSLVLPMPHRYYVSLLVSLLFLVSHLFSFSWSVFITAPSLTVAVPIWASLPFLYPLLKLSFIRMLSPSSAFATCRCPLSSFTRAPLLPLCSKGLLEAAWLCSLPLGLCTSSTTRTIDDSGSKDSLQLPAFVYQPSQ